ncbi:MAG: hypothetical protein M3Q08_01215 [Pseudomonadota bacterium]|nr:hypothetical protein [Pseudomonadota bacterium]
MTTTTGVFGDATAFCAQPTAPSPNLALDHLGSIRRHLRGILVQGGSGTASTSPLISITGSRPRTYAAPARTTDPRPAERIVMASEESVVFAEVVTEIPEARAGRADNDHARTAAQDLVDRIRAASGLTLEEIAPLLQISRRALQKWRAGAAISTGNERRLRNLADVIDRIATADEQTTRRRLLDRQAGSVSAYDLLSEERFDAAVAMATGVKGKTKYTPNPGGLRDDIAARLSPVPEIETLPLGTPSARRLRRSRP